MRAVEDDRRRCAGCQPGRDPLKHTLLRRRLTNVGRLHNATDGRNRRVDLGAATEVAAHTLARRQWRQNIEGLFANRHENPACPKPMTRIKD
jgi:hypothetical protein